MTIDREQIALNDGPPCFAWEGDHFCSRAQRWAGHGLVGGHPFIPLADLIGDLKTWIAERGSNWRKEAERVERLMSINARTQSARRAAAKADCIAELLAYMVRPQIESADNIAKRDQRTIDMLLDDEALGLRREDDRADSAHIADRLSAMISASRIRHIETARRLEAERISEGSESEGSADPRADLAIERAKAARLKRLAKEATNGWACYARTKLEHDDISRLHKALDAIKLYEELPEEGI